MSSFIKGLEAFRKWIILILVLAAGIWVWNKFGNLPSPSAWFKPADVRIDETPILITEIKSIAQLQTAQLYCEVVTDSVVMSDTEAALEALKNTLMLPVIIPGKLSGPKKIVMIVKGKVTAGIDLRDLQESDLKVKGDSVWLTLPHARILDVIVNPSDTEIFMEEGTWTSAEQNAVKQKGLRVMQKLAAEKQLEKQAEEKAINLMKNFLESAGFGYVSVGF
jgi:hypothetical protein